MRKISELVEEIKSREKSELIDALVNYGKKTKEGFKAYFDEDTNPIIAGYIGDDPCDIVIKSVLVTPKGNVVMTGLEKNDPYDEWEVTPDEIFAGHLSYVTETFLSLK